MDGTHTPSETVIEKQRGERDAFRCNLWYINHELKVSRRKSNYNDDRCHCPDGGHCASAHSVENLVITHSMGQEAGHVALP
jgi:hypothetical protein